MSVELLLTPPIMQSTAPAVRPKEVPDKSREVMVLLWRIISRSDLADSISFKELSDISSTLMDVLRYNAGASSTNPTLPRVLPVKIRVCKLGVLHIASPRRDQEERRLVAAW
jgi:hypothetical protein